MTKTNDNIEDTDHDVNRVLPVSRLLIYLFTDLVPVRSQRQRYQGKEEKSGTPSSTSGPSNYNTSYYPGGCNPDRPRYYE